MNVAAQLFAAFFALCAAGAVAAFVVSARQNPVVLAIIGSLAALAVLAASAFILITGASFRAELWPVLSLGMLTLTADRLSALFLFITGLVFLPVSIFSGTYLAKYIEHHSLRYFSVLYHALFASIVLVLVADDAISFLVAWELMTIASYLLVNYEYERAESSHAGYVMLAMSEGGTICGGDSVHAPRERREHHRIRGNKGDRRWTFRRDRLVRFFALVLRLCGQGGTGSSEQLAAARSSCRPNQCFRSAVGNGRQPRHLRGDAG